MFLLSTIKHIKDQTKLKKINLISMPFRKVKIGSEFLILTEFFVVEVWKVCY